MPYQSYVIYNRIQAKTTDLLKKNNYHNKKDTETQFDVLQTKIEYLDKTFNCDISLNNSGDYTQLGYSFNGNKTKDDSVETVDYINDLNKENTQVLSSNSNNTKNSKTFVYGYDKIKENNDYYVEKINGSISKVLDSKGNTKKSYEYSDYGQELNGYKVGFTYNGEMVDSNGLQYLRARYLDVSTGMFIQKDSYTGENNNIISQNQYTYVLNNPYKYVDEDGRRPNRGYRPSRGGGSNSSYGNRRHSGKGNNRNYYVRDPSTGGSRTSYKKPSVNSKSKLSLGQGIDVMTGRNQGGPPRNPDGSIDYTKFNPITGGLLNGLIETVNGTKNFVKDFIGDSWLEKGKKLAGIVGFGLVGFACPPLAIIGALGFGIYSNKDRFGKMTRTHGTLYTISSFVGEYGSIAAGAKVMGSGAKNVNNRYYSDKNSKYYRIISGAKTKAKKLSNQIATSFKKGFKGIKDKFTSIFIKAKKQKGLPKCTKTQTQVNGVRKKRKLNRDQNKTPKYKQYRLKKGNTMTARIKIPKEFSKEIGRDSDGYTKSNRYTGTKIHKWWAKKFDNAKMERHGEYTIPGTRKRVDGVDLKNKIIYELKPNNPRSVKQGQKQLDNYVKLMEKATNQKGWKKIIITY